MLRTRMYQSAVLQLCKLRIISSADNIIGKAIPAQLTLTGMYKTNLRLAFTGGCV